MNETFIQNGKNINGIEFTIKKRSAHIKLWTKKFTEDSKFIKELPTSLMKSFESEIEKINRGRERSFDRGYDRSYDALSIQYKQIKPEYEI